MVWSTVIRILKHREDALDCCQEIFIEAMERGQRKPVDDWGAFLRWLATRRAIDVLRRRRPSSSELVAEICDSALSVEEKVVFDELVEVVRNELPALPEQQAEAFWLVCVEQQTYKEVAQQLGVESNAVGVLVHRARQQLRSRLKSLHPSSSES